MLLSIWRVGCRFSGLSYGVIENHEEVFVVPLPAVCGGNKQISKPTDRQADRQTAGQRTQP